MARVDVVPSGIPAQRGNERAETRERLAKAVTDLAGKYGARDVALFLHAFIEQPDVAWPVLAELLGSDPKLALDDRSAD